MYFFGQIKGWKGLKDKIPFLVFYNDRLVFSDQVINPEHLGINRLKGSEDLIKPIFRVPVYQNKKVDLNNIRVFLIDPVTGIYEMEMARSALTYPEELIPKHQFYGAFPYCENEKAPAGNKTKTMKEKGGGFSNECF